MYIKSIRFENLKSFKRLEFDFQRPEGGFAGWTVFVGGNSSGKSTLLKGIALALMGPDAGRQLMGSTSGWIQKGERKASASAQLSWEDPFDTFKRGGKLPGAEFEAGVRWLVESKEDTVPAFRSMEKRSTRGTRIQTAERGPWDPNAKGWFSVGYGPMRRLSGFSQDSIRYAVGGGIVSRFVTLFREDAALSESEEWLRHNHSRLLESKKPELKRLLDGVHQLLSDNLLPHGMKITRITVDHVFLQDKRGLELPMRDLSDGCRSLYATVLDLVHGMFEVYGSEGLFARDDAGRVIVDRPGVVLIDEMESHLHPAWQREVPLWLKTHFPRIQFLVTTHSPLIVQAADPNGVFVLPLQDDLDREPRPLTPGEYEKIRWGRAEKTLLGVAFGLKSTRSRWANQQIEHWKRLNAKKQAGAPLTPLEKSEYQDLHKQMMLALEPVGELEAP
jgi:hypothetical protein